MRLLQTDLGSLLDLFRRGLFSKGTLFAYPFAGERNAGCVVWLGW